MRLQVPPSSEEDCSPTKSTTTETPPLSEEELDEQPVKIEEDDDEDGDEEMAELNDVAPKEEGQGEDDGDEQAEVASVASYSALQFVDWVELYEIDCEYTSDEEKMMWFTSGDYSAFLEECEDMAKEIEDKEEKGEGDDIEMHDMIGLEAWTKDGYKKRQKIRLSAIDAVLDEQFAQWDDGKENPEAISEMYIAKAEEAKVHANTKAVNLEEHVQEYLEPTIEEYSEFKSTLSVASGTSRSIRSSMKKSTSFDSISTASLDLSLDEEDEDQDEEEEDMPDTISEEQEEAEEDGSDEEEPDEDEDEEDNDIDRCSRR